VIDPLLDSLLAFLAIPSVSSGTGDPGALRDAAAFVGAIIAAAGGTVEIAETRVNPLVLAELRASRPGAPTVIAYGHYDVQAPDPIAAWTTPPFAPAIRDGMVYARGACDDKGQLLPLVWAACELARTGALPVNVRFLVDGEEEVGGRSAEDWLLADTGPADAAIAFDSRMPDPATPVLVTSARGALHVTVTVRSALHDLHSGAGNAVLNAAHVLHRVLAAVLPDEHGRLPEPLRRGALRPTEAERRGWARLPAGDRDIASLGGRPHDAGAGEALPERMGFWPSVDVHGIETGDARQVRTQIPAEARAMLSMRLAPGQASTDLWPVLEGLLLRAAPPGADVSVRLNNACEPARIDPNQPVLAIARHALADAAGVEPILVPAGGSLPVLAGFAARGIPAILTGFGVRDNRVHAPDECFRIESLRLAERAARALYIGLGALYDGTHHDVETTGR
jgi:acetylornithine deacetylase/succinyl-diaminopimelate desuccinylase-like protein